jgi:ABC-type uncharacterized transport system auxiliary subunit
MKKVFLVLLLSAPFWIFCAKKTMIRNYYLLEFPQEISEIQTEQAFPLEVDVRDFQVSRAFAQTRIALRTESNEINYFYYHHWAIRPSYAVADQVYTILNHKELFAKCTRGITYDPDYRIDGNVQVIERNHMNETQSAHLVMTMQFTDTESSISHVQHRFDRSLPLEDKSMNDFAEKMSQIILDETLSFSQQIKAFLQNEN